MGYRQELKCSLSLELKYWKAGAELVLASLTNEIKTILADPFIKDLVDDLNNLNDKHVKVILIDNIGDKIHESEDNIIKKYIDSFKHVIIDNLSEIDRGLVRVTLNI